MDRSSLYDNDIHAWAEQQAAVLRRLAEIRSDLPNDLDLEHVAEEIEDVGIGQRTAAESFIRLIFVHLMKLHAAPQSTSAHHWRAEIVTFHSELLERLTPSMHARIDLGKLWRRASKEASARLVAESEPNALLRAELGRPPLAISDLAQEDFDADGALARMRHGT